MFFCLFLVLICPRVHCIATGNASGTSQECAVFCIQYEEHTNLMQIKLGALKMLI